MTERIDPEANTLAAPVIVSQAARAPTESAPPLVAGRYELLGLIGAGAMGTVYRARDRELDELVALKVLRRELAASEDMLDRFRREVKLARRVTHKNVARMFDIGEHLGEKFLTMEFIEGESLASLLERRSVLMPGEVIRLATDICSGLEAAHAANVLHRDLKPENVIVASDGRAVITDFGIARATEPDMSRTQGGIIGTPAYMAPEQVEGAADLDGRADLYALGAMLYELVTGEPAWQGTSVIAIASARLLHPPPDPRKRMPSMPDALAELVLRLMARKRDDRFASATETLAALRDMELIPTGAADEPPPSVRHARPATGKSLAVLPVVNLGVPDDAYLASNLTEDLADDLSIVPSLRVRPRGTTEKYTDPGRDVREIGRICNVDVVVDASMRRIGDLVRVSVRLVTVEDGFQLWAQRYDRPPSEVLAIASEAAQAVARALTAEMQPQEVVATRDPSALDLFLRGRYLVRRGWFETGKEGTKLLAEAYRRAPNDARIAGTYALALARAFGNSNVGVEAMNDAYRIAEEALAVDPDQPEARVCIGMLHLYLDRPEAAVAELRRALAGAPNDVDALDALARIEGEIGRIDDALARFSKAIAIAGDRSRIRYQLTRLRSLIEDDLDLEGGPDAEDVAELIAWTFLRARVCTWRRDRAGAQRLGEWFASVNVKTTLRNAVEVALRVTATGKISDEDRKVVLDALPIDASRTPRNCVFHAQLRAEVHMAASEIEEALAALLIADHHGLLDLVWLEKVAAFAPLREMPVYRDVHASVTERARRVMAALDA